MSEHSLISTMDDETLEKNILQVYNVVNNLIDGRDVRQDPPLEVDIKINQNYQELVYDGLKLIRQTSANIKKDKLKDFFSREIEKLEYKLDKKLEVNEEAVEELIETSLEERAFKNEYTRKAGSLAVDNERLRKEVWGDDSEEKEVQTDKLFSLAIGYLKEGLTNYSLGKEDKAKECISMANEEFSELSELIRSPRNLDVLAREYIEFHEEVTELGFEIDDYKADIEKRKQDNLTESTTQPLIDGENVHDALFEHYTSTKLAEGGSKLLAQRNELSQMTFQDTVLDVFVKGMLICQSDYEYLEKHGNNRQPYQHEIQLQDQDGMTKIKELEQIITTSALILQDRISDPKVEEKYLKTLNEAKRAKYEILKGAVAVDPKDIDNVPEGLKPFAINVMMTEQDIGDGSALIADTFRQYVTRRLSGRKELPALYGMRQREGSSLDTNKAWGAVTGAVKGFKQLDQYGVAKLALIFRKAKEEGIEVAPLMRTAINNYFEGIQQRPLIEKMKGLVSGLFNSAKQARIAYQRKIYNQ